MPHPLDWSLTDLESVPKNGLTVFSLFHCGGGSTMGYKLAGCTVLGGFVIGGSGEAMVAVQNDLLTVYLTDDCGPSVV